MKQVELMEEYGIAFIKMGYWETEPWTIIVHTDATKEIKEIMKHIDNLGIYPVIFES